MPSLIVRLAPWLFVVLWSTGFLGAKLGLPYADPGAFLFVRFAILSVLLCAFVSLSVAVWPREMRFYGHQAVIGLLMHGLYLGGVFGGISLGISAGLAALIVGLQPVLTALFAAFWLRERLSAGQWSGFVLGFAGVVLVLLDRHGVGGFGWQGNADGLALCLLALCAISAGTIYQKRYGQEAALLPATAVQYSAAALLMACVAPLWGSMAIQWTGEFVFALAWLVLVLSFAAIALLSHLIRQGAASHVASLFYLVPPLVALEAWWLFDEELGPQALVGLVLVMVAVRLVRRVRA